MLLKRIHTIVFITRTHAFTQNGVHSRRIRPIRVARYILVVHHPENVFNARNIVAGKRSIGLTAVAAVCGTLSGGRDAWSDAHFEK